MAIHKPAPASRPIAKPECITQVSYSTEIPLSSQVPPPKVQPTVTNLKKVALEDKLDEIRKLNLVPHGGPITQRTIQPSVNVVSRSSKSMPDPVPQKSIFPLSPPKFVIPGVPASRTAARCVLYFIAHMIVQTAIFTSPNTY